MRWNHLWNQKLFSNTTLTFSNYGLEVASAFGTEFNIENELEEISLSYQSGIRDIGLKIDFDYLPNPDHFIRFGIGLTHHHFKPCNFDLRELDTREDYNFDITVGQDNINALETQVYVEDDWKINDRFKVNLGAHMLGFYVDNTFYLSIQPRLSGRFLLDDQSSIKASVTTMRQFIHLLAFDGIGLPTDLWLASTTSVKPQDSYQFAIGYARELDKSFELSIEAYYKKMDNLIAYQEGSGLFEFSDWQSRITQGEGKSYGAEVFFQKRLGRLTGWVGYTLSWTNRQFDDLNFGETFPYRYDRRHDISIVGQYKISDRVNISGTWMYGTGNAVTLSSGRYYAAIDNGQYTNFEDVNYYEERNNFRMGAYHRLDVGINFRKKKKNHTRTWSFGAYNTYARKNPFFIYDDIDFVNGERTYVLKQASLFPLIPYFNYSFEF